MKRLSKLLLISMTIGLISLIDTHNAHAEENMSSEMPAALLDTNDANVPVMSLSEAIESGATEVILSEIDIPEIADELDKVADNSYLLFRAKGYWKYKYTAEPYAFYQHTTTKKWKMVQVTSTTNHLVNTMIGGWAGAPSWNISYNPPRR
ncbi:hypothetical protein [Enterococcus sp. DIV1420a]|uniref:hypothetical protein n=1 Tax=Enterococcus TaxID=1350 RepID=UPI003F27E77B